MQIKSGIKIGILFLFVLCIIIGGFIMFRRLSHNKQVFETDLHSLVPSNITEVLQINKEKDVNRLTSYLNNDICFLIKAFANTLNYPLSILKREDNLTIMSKLTTQQEEKVKFLLEHKLYPDFSPKERIYKEAKFLFYTTNDNSFFCCMFYKGIFAGGFNYKQLEDIVDADINNNFFGRSDITTILEKIKPTYSASLFIKEEAHFSAFNIIIQDSNTLKLDGYTNLDLHTALSCDKKKEESRPFSIDTAIFPDSLSAYQINMNTACISDSIGCLFSVPTYKLYIKGNHTSPIYALKPNVDKFVVYNMLNDMEQLFIHRKFNTKDFAFGNQRIYTASAQLSKSVFKQDAIVYLSFYNDYLVFSIDKRTLVYYLKNNGNYRNTNIESDIMESDISNPKAIFYTSDPKNIVPDYFDFNKYLLFQSAPNSIHSIIYAEKNDRKFNVTLNN